MHMILEHAKEKPRDIQNYVKQNINFSKDLRELLDNEDKIINLYEKIKQFSLN